jgi:hypothetical protein
MRSVKYEIAFDSPQQSEINWIEKAADGTNSIYREKDD